ncbi:CS1-pili formation C-terminal domain-containing protein [Rheinheimera sp. NSM]|uniref:CS1-pili formation C-terminal domain-containing protein n=1 Tax=Rheinheimera sp. NSM TaxID=3457884 RepID=UPI0040370A1A
MMISKLPFKNTVLHLCLSLALTATVQAQTPPPAQRSLLAQAAGMPAEFAGHFFDVPLAVRVELDGKLLGEAMITLSTDEQIQLLNFTASDDISYSSAEQQRWAGILSQSRPLGRCDHACPANLLALHYSLENSQLSIVTHNAEQNPAQAKFHHLPQQASNGVMLRNQLNVSHSGQQLTGNYNAEILGSLGNWTGMSSLQLTETGEHDQSLRYAMPYLYAQRELEGSFFRAGYFTPSAQGIIRQPQSRGGAPDSTLGVMIGSSDSLAVSRATPSATPIYVTANRPAMVEIHRNGVLLYSQSVQPGLHTLDTRGLPGGIYPVEVRLIEDGVVTSRSEEFVYKPTNWHNTEQRWRYNLYLGRQSRLLNNWHNNADGELSAGVMLNYLLHPRAILGLSGQRIDGTMQYGSSLDWQLNSRSSLYTNLYHSANLNTGIDLQYIYRYTNGDLLLSHNRSWLDITTDYGSYSGKNQQSAIAWQQRLSYHNSVSMRLSNARGNNNGTGVDLSWLHNGSLAGSDATWRLSVFDRPASISSGSQRNHGIELNLNINLGGKNQRVAASIGSRTARDGNRDHNASLNWQQYYDEGLVRNLAGTVSADRYGVSLAGNTGFSNSVLQGDAYAQQSSYNHQISGGLNLQSTVAIGDKHIAASGESTHAEAGLIIDVESDVEQLQLRADDPAGFSTTLQPGRNFIAVNPYKAGTVQFDFADNEAHALAIQPAMSSYHLNRGGVAYRQIRVMKTVTVLGRLLGSDGQPLSGHQVINHASRSVTEASGFFAVEMSESSPTLDVQHKGRPLCALTLNPAQHQRENDTLLVGDLQCDASLAQQQPPATAASLSNASAPN